MLLGFHGLNKFYDGEEDKIVIWKICSVSGKRYEVHLTPAQADEMMNPNRPNIQVILPRHSVAEREFLISGITPAEWDRTFGNPLEDDK